MWNRWGALLRLPIRDSEPGNVESLEGTAVLRMGAMVVALELAAVLVAFGYFGWPILVAGVPVIVITVIALLVVRASEAPRRKLQEHRESRWDPDAALPGGLMSGFFEVPRRPRQP
jgi:hypothetical protein